MKKEFYIISLICFCGQNLFSQATLPSAKNLRTDLMEHTDRVFHNGNITNLRLEDMKSSIESLQTVDIKSQKPTFSWVIPNVNNGTYQKNIELSLQTIGKNLFHLFQRKTTLMQNQIFR
jgi:hypothetical protein